MLTTDYVNSAWPSLQGRQNESRQGAIQIHVYLALSYHLYNAIPKDRTVLMIAPRSKTFGHSYATFHILFICVTCTVICLSFCLKVASFDGLLPVLAACHTFLLFACNCIGE